MNDGSLKILKIFSQNGVFLYKWHIFMDFHAVVYVDFMQ